uniref:Uncharacterized protein n=1 Tax=Oryza meridionalis TaxID=40149 RepID=A0A0E0DT64_9ORYZ
MGKKEEQDTGMEVVGEPMEEDYSNNNSNEWKYRENPGFQEAYSKMMKLIEEEDRLEDEENAAAAEAAKPGRKRGHALKAGELNDVETTKRYKCNYWADPASRRVVRRLGPEVGPLRRSP